MEEVYKVTVSMKEVVFWLSRVLQKVVGCRYHVTFWQVFSVADVTAATDFELEVFWVSSVVRLHGFLMLFKSLLIVYMWLFFDKASEPLSQCVYGSSRVGQKNEWD